MNKEIAEGPAYSEEFNTLLDKVQKGIFSSSQINSNNQGEGKPSL